MRVRHSYAVLRSATLCPLAPETHQPKRSRIAQGQLHPSGGVVSNGSRVPISANKCTTTATPERTLREGLQRSGKRQKKPLVPRPVLPVRLRQDLSLEHTHGKAWWGVAAPHSGPVRSGRSAWPQDKVTGGVHRMEIRDLIAASVFCEAPAPMRLSMRPGAQPH
jgi:hypothetical protein